MTSELGQIVRREELQPLSFHLLTDGSCFLRTNSVYTLKQCTCVALSTSVMKSSYSLAPPDSVYIAITGSFTVCSSFVRNCQAESKHQCLTLALTIRHSELLAAQQWTI